MTVPETGTTKVKIAVEARLMSSGTGSRRLWVAQVGAFEGRSTRKPDALAELAASIEKAVLRTDLGAVVRVGVADGRAYVLHSRHDGGYELCSAPLPAAGQVSSVDTTGPDYVTRAVAVDDFASRVERAQDGAKAPPNAEVALRKLADRLGVDAAGDWQAVAQRVAMAFAEADRRGVLAEADAAAARTVFEVSAAGETPEGAALARLLGLRGSFDLRPDPAQVRRAAESILAESRGERHGATLGDASPRDPVTGPWLALVDSCVHEDDDAVVQAALDIGGVVDVCEVEEYIVEHSWPDDGVLDQHLAGIIGDPESGLGGQAEKALDKRLADARASAEPARVVAEALETLGLRRGHHWRQRRFRMRSLRRAPAKFGPEGFLPLAHLPECAEVGLDENDDVAFDCAPDCPADRVDEGDRLAALLAELCDELDHRGCVSGRSGQRRGVGAVVDEARSLLKQYGRIQ